MFKIALIHPDIPQNTGNIGRLCVGLDIELHLVHPMGFVLDDKKIRRSGLDYWQDLKLFQHASVDVFLKQFQTARLLFLTTKAKKIYSDIGFQHDDVIVFGSETKGLPENLLKQYWDQAITIPMPGKVRSLNVSNAASTVAYEVYRQLNGTF